MTSAQTRMYWREWSACRKALLGHGYADDETEAQRHRIHIEACGVDVSSKKLTNAQLDAILSIFRAYSRPADLAEQLRIIDQPEQRLQAFRDRALKIATIVCDERGPTAYLETLARSVAKRRFDALRETEVMQLVGILQRRAKQLGKTV